MLNGLNKFWIRGAAAAVLVAAIAAAVLIGPHSFGATSPIATAPSSTAPYSETESTYNLLPVLNSQTAPPLVMLLLSRDEQLSVKAYTDYTDLLAGQTGDTGAIQTTYADTITYDGYFDPTLCYNYSTTTNLYKAGANVASGTHQCAGGSNPWSGNFLNWLTMSRMDIVRWVLYGGKRSTDSTTQTILQRAFIPDDVHSWAKVYPNSDINLYTPYSTNPITFCNTSNTSSATAYSSTSYVPYLLIATGAWPNWASTEASQCQWSNASNGNNGTTDRPASNSSGSYTLDVFVDVCDNTTASLRESFCETYTYNGTNYYKPSGLLQQFGESGQLRFGLITGSYDEPRSGGVIRRNIGQIAGNAGQATACTTGDEIDLRYGTFCNQTANTQGIINTLNRFQVTQWPGAPGSNGTYSDCNNYDIVNRDASGTNGYLNDPGTNKGLSGKAAQNCSDWGNPLAEMYAEALRYITNTTASPATPTSGFQPSTTGIDNSLGLPYGLTWTPPYSTSNQCATCSIIILSTGQTSFDTDEIPSINNFPTEGPTGATTRIGTNEAISGTVLTGYYGTTPLQSTTSTTALNNDYTSLCVGQSVTDLNLVRGICPEVPALEGGYQLAGLAFDAWTNDLIPTTAIAGTQRVRTFAISLAESLPSLTIPVGTNTVTLAPLCQSNATGGGGSNPINYTSGSTQGQLYPGWRACSFSNVQVGQQASLTGGTLGTFGLPISPTNNYGSISIVWDDSSWGNDHDLDEKSMISWCAGSACNSFTVGGTGSNSNQLLICQNTDSNSPICSSTNNKPTIGANQMLVRVEDIYCFAGNDMLAGFTVAGSASAAIGSGISGSAAVYGGGLNTTTGAQTVNGDGAQRLFLRPGNSNVNLLTATSYPTNWSKPQVVLVNAGTSTITELQNPLFYAAKYGGFSYTPGTTNPVPTQAVSADWSTGVSGPGLPDNYFPVHNPGLLATQLNKVFTALAASTGSGTSAAVVASQRQGDGATYQALYIPTKTDTTNNTGTWLGQLQALFVDSEGNLREDTTPNSATLAPTNFTTNPAVVLYYNTTSNTTMVLRYTCDPTTGTACTSTGTSDSLDNLNTIWSARDVLASQNNGVSTAQRGYNTAAAAGAGRYIFTFVDANLNGAVDSGEQLPFVASTFTGSTATYGILNVPDSTSAANLVNFTRGEDQAGLRSRTLAYASAKNKSNTQYTYPLGDIVNSSPAVEAAPSEAYDTLYNDQTYSAFRTAYAQRRNVIYVGANDGMLHAFNGGFYNATTTSFTTTPSSTSAATAHPLGSELWAYVPFNLLPHLTWLASSSYTASTHVFYFDGAPRTFDAHVFANGGACTPATSGTKQDCHPYGWGTIMVAGMRFGGGDLKLPACSAPSGTPATSTILPSFNGFSLTCSTTATTTVNTHSAYVVLDITNPEEPPTVLAEVSGSTPLQGNVMGYTTSFPTDVGFSALGNSITSVPTTDSWYFVVGSGPTGTSSTNPGVGTAVSTQDAKLFVYQMANSSGTTTVTSSTVFDLGNTTSGVGTAAQSAFTGDAVAQDWNLDFIVDDLYVGIASGSPTSPSGQLLKISTNQKATPGSWTVSTLTNPAAPVLATPSVTTDAKGNQWVYDGTGRLYVSADLSGASQQYLFGVIDGSSTPTFSGLTDVTNAEVLVSANGSGATITGVTGVTNESTLESTVQADHGWKMELATFPSTDTTDGAQRVLSPSPLSGSTLFSTAFTPNTSLCLGTGLSTIFAVNYITGAANPANPALGTDSTGTYYLSSVSAGVGEGAEAALHTNDTNGSAYGSITAIVQNSTGALDQQKASVSNSVGPSEIDWRQTHPNSGP